MTQVFCGYSEFKSDLLRKASDLTEEDISNLVAEYDPVINSKRRSSYIKNCDDLISLLEKRAHVSPDDFKELKNIVQRLPNANDKSEMLLRLNRSTGVAELSYGHTYANGSPSTEPTTSSHALHSNSTNRCSLPNEVVEHICEEIGYKWRDLGRKLGFKEGELDVLHKDNRKDEKASAYQMLQNYQSKHKDQQKMVEKLLTALEKARRRDLRDKIEEMLKECQRN